MAARLLLIEDEEDIRIALADRLRAEGHRVTEETRGDDGYSRLSREPFDLVILDLMLPGLNGLDLCRKVRADGLSVPILMLTARGGVTDRVVGLRLGADDYLAKPFDLSELLARVDSLLRRSATPAAGAQGGVFAFGDLVLDTRQAQLRRGDVPISLSAKEYQLLRYFVAHPEEAISRDRLLDDVWGYEATTRTVDVHVSSLRKKMGDLAPVGSQHIQTLRGIGYKFLPEGHGR